MVITGLTRNQLGSNPPRVRISPSPPKNRLVSTSRFFYPLRSDGISSRVSVYIIKGGIAAFVSHHTFRCVSKTFRNDDMQSVALMIYNSFGIDDMHGFAVILSQGSSYRHRTCFLTLAINVAVNMCGGSHIRVTKPVLNHFHRHTVCEE